MRDWEVLFLLALAGRFISLMVLWRIGVLFKTRKDPRE